MHEALTKLNQNGIHLKKEKKNDIHFNINAKE